MTAVTIGSRSAANASSCSGEETLAKLFFAEYGTVDDLRAAATAAIEQGRAALEVVRRQGRVYVEAGGEFPERCI